MGRWGIVAVVVLAVAVVGSAAFIGVAELAGWNDDGTGAAPTTTILDAATIDHDRVTSTVAEAVIAEVPVYDRPFGARVTEVDQPDDPPRPLVFLVVDEEPDWLRVLLPIRPNGSNGWIRAGDVRLFEHDYRIRVELGAHRITVRKGTETILEGPIAVGQAQTPTPGGLYYIKELLQPPNPNTVYGPYAYGLSGFSNVLTEFEGGPGVVGLHGNNDPSVLGQDVSAGCIRMANADIVRLVEQVGLPLGVPVEILE